jgi:hypothetical protein
MQLGHLRILAQQDPREAAHALEFFKNLRPETAHVTDRETGSDFCPWGLSTVVTGSASRNQPKDARRSAWLRRPALLSIGEF